jgi:hypothetical protein
MHDDEEKSSSIHMIVLFSLCGFYKFMTRSHTHPNWEQLHLNDSIHIELKLSEIMVEVKFMIIPHRVLHLALAMRTIDQFLLNMSHDTDEFILSIVILVLLLEDCIAGLYDSNS